MTEPLNIAIGALSKISNADYRGNRPRQAVEAFNALQAINALQGSDERPWDESTDRRYPIGITSEEVAALLTLANKADHAFSSARRAVADTPLVDDKCPHPLCVNGLVGLSEDFDTGMLDFDEICPDCIKAGRILEDGDMPVDDEVVDPDENESNNNNHAEPVSVEGGGPYRVEQTVTGEWAIVGPTIKGERTADEETTRLDCAELNAAYSKGFTAGQKRELLHIASLESDGDSLHEYLTDQKERSDCPDLVDAALELLHAADAQIYGPPSVEVHARYSLARIPIRRLEDESAALHNTPEVDDDAE